MADGQGGRRIRQRGSGGRAAEPLARDARGDLGGVGREEGREQHERHADYGGHVGAVPAPRGGGRATTHGADGEGHPGAGL